MSRDKVAVFAPDVNVTDVALTRFGLSEVMSTTVPGAAGEPKVSDPIVCCPPVIVVGFNENELIVGDVTANIALAVCVAALAETLTTFRFCTGIVDI